jgi:hypothetical protein
MGRHGPIQFIAFEWGTPMSTVFALLCSSFLVAGDSDGWDYRAAEYDVMVRLPKGWRESPRKDKSKRATFFAAGSPSPMLASLAWVKNTTMEEYGKLAQAFWDEQIEGKDWIEKPSLERGKTKEGNPYTLIIAHEKGDKDNTYLYVAVAFVWLQEKKSCVQMLFEGQGKMLSRVFKEAEHRNFENAAKTICISPR